MMKLRTSLSLMIAATLISGCGVGKFTPNATYTPAPVSAKAFGAYGVGVLPIDDQRPSPSQDSSGGGGSILGCILIGGIMPVITASIEHMESGDSQVLNAYNPTMQRMQRGGPGGRGMKMASTNVYNTGGILDPLVFLRQNLVKEFQHNKMLGAAQPVESDGVTPFTLKTTLRSSKIYGRTYCYTPMDTTWIWWMLGLPFSTYRFELKMDLSLFGPGGGDPVWTYTVDTKTGGTTNFYYATGATGENNVEQIYNDLMAQAMAKASADLETALKEKRPEFWNKIAAPVQSARLPKRAEPERVEKPAESPAESGEAPWWKQNP